MVVLKTIISNNPLTYFLDEFPQSNRTIMTVRISVLLLELFVFRNLTFELLLVTFFSSMNNKNMIQLMRQLFVVVVNNMTKWGVMLPFLYEPSMSFPFIWIISLLIRLYRKFSTYFPTTNNRHALCSNSPPPLPFMGRSESTTCDHQHWTQWVIRDHRRRMEREYLKYVSYNWIYYISNIVGVEVK